VVLVNFWATWCPPCRKEMPDMDRLYKRFQIEGLIVLAISNEEEAVVRKFVGEHPYSFPILLDPGGKTGKAYLVQGIPKSFVYDRRGEIVATAVDQHTERQFLEMLAKAGLR
jgi:thiol-disulfide isomerase/thioredoxin